MKTCPFCKNSITDDNDICPECQRVLVERIGAIKERPSPHAAQRHSTTKRHKNFNFKWNNFKKYVPIIVLLLVIIFLSTREDKKHEYATYSPPPVSVIPDSDDMSTASDVSQPVPAKDPKTYFSLPNGTILSSKSLYLNGLGELQIKNGTSLDAIAKLVNIVLDKSIFTVYIEANSTYKINKIKDGNYKLFFNLGNDWDAGLKAFTTNSGYEVFEDPFNFTTQEYEEGNYIKTRYSTFEVTLNPVIGGQAETENVSVLEFAKY